MISTRQLEVTKHCLDFRGNDKQMIEGNLNLIRFAHLVGVQNVPNRCAFHAAAGNQLKILSWALKNRPQNPRWNRKFWTPLVCAAAARAGSLEALKLLRAFNCPWDADTCTAAALGGNVEVLKYLRENQCEWSASKCMLAAKWMAHTELLQWCLDNDHGPKSPTLPVLNFLGKKGDIHFPLSQAPVCLISYLTNILLLNEATRI